MKKTIAVSLLLLSALILPGAAQEVGGPSGLENLLRPIAIYPDPLLAQILPAATEPSQLKAAAEWLVANPSGDIDSAGFSPAVTAVAHYPDVLEMLNSDPSYTEALGQAFTEQSGEVLATIQGLRKQAYDFGNLVSTPEQTVNYDNNSQYLSIVPTSPNLMYVPYFNPSLVYYPQTMGSCGSLVSFRLGSRCGPWLSFGLDWMGGNCFSYPVGTYWGCPRVVYSNYCNPVYVHNYLNPNNCRNWSRSAPVIVNRPVNNNYTHAGSYSNSRPSYNNVPRSGGYYNTGSYNSGYNNGYYNNGYNTNGYSRGYNTGYSRGYVTNFRTPSLNSNPYRWNGTNVRSTVTSGASHHYSPGMLQNSQFQRPMTNVSPGYQAQPSFQKPTQSPQYCPPAGLSTGGFTNHSNYRNSAVHTQPSFQSRPSFNSQPSFQSRPSFNSQPSFQSRPSFSSQPSFQSRPSFSSQPSFQSRPSFNSQPSFQSRPSFSSQPSFQSRPSFHSGSTSGGSFHRSAPSFSSGGGRTFSSGGHHGGGRRR